MSISIYEPKRAQFALLTELARTGPLATLGVGGGPVQVKYDARARDMQAVCIYGGPVRRERKSDEQFTDGTRIAVAATVASTWFIRVADDVDMEIIDLERQAEAIGAVLEELLAARPAMSGPGTETTVFAEEGNYRYDDDNNLVELAYEIHTDMIV